MIPWLAADDDFPPVARALREPNGLLAAGADLSVPRLVQAYRRGIFPWYSDDQPILWWSPDPRMVLYPGELKVSRSLGKRLRRRDYRVTADTAFAQVIRACSQPRADDAGTWITEAMVEAYCALHRAGHAHSVETWMDGDLAGGLYGVALGRAFFGESMFTLRPDASKIAFVHLVRQLRRRDCGVIDCQMATAHLARFGAREVPRTEFLRKLGELVNYPQAGGEGEWRLDDDLSD
jgi:leucyl/phenylalanyl-tRNA--protein transferase